MESAKKMEHMMSTRRRYRGPIAPRTGVGWSDAACATMKRPGSATQPRERVHEGKRNERQREDPAEAECAGRKAVDDGREAGPSRVASRDQGDGRCAVAAPVSSAAMTSASAFVALSNGRPNAKMTTNHQ